MSAPIVTVAGGVRLEARPLRDGTTCKLRISLYDIAREEEAARAAFTPETQRGLAAFVSIIVTDDELADLNHWLGRIGVAFTQDKHALEEQLAADEVRRARLLHANGGTANPLDLLSEPAKQWLREHQVPEAA